MNMKMCFFLDSQYEPMIKANRKIFAVLDVDLYKPEQRFLLKNDTLGKFTSFSVLTKNS